MHDLPCHVKVIDYIHRLGSLDINTQKGENSIPFLINTYVLVICYLSASGMENSFKYMVLGSRAF